MQANEPALTWKAPPKDNGDATRRFAEPNAGKSIHTSKYKPWRLVTYVAFSDELKAASFERYLKPGSGHAFAKRHLRLDRALLRVFSGP
jgi:putative endonuclease